MKNTYLRKLLGGIMLLGFFLLISDFAESQYTIQLGSGTSITGTTTASPINIYYRSLHCQTVYTAAELTAAGASAGNILAMGYYVYNAPASALPNFSVKMKLTTATLPTTYDATGLTQVYFNTSYAPVSSTWDMLTLNTPFMWDGVSNVLVDVCFDQVPAYSSTGRVYYYSVTNGFRSVRLDSAPQCAVATSSNSVYKPQIKFTLAPLHDNDALIDHFVTDAVCEGPTDISVFVKNNGTLDLDSVTVGWSVNGVVQTPVNYTTTIPSFQGNTVPLGSYVFQNGSLYDIIAWTSSPNGAIDEDPSNDTLSMLDVATGVSGTYSIGAAGDFATFGAAVHWIDSLGLCGPIEFIANPGTYSEQVTIPAIAGTSASNTITFRSLNNDSSSVILTYGASGTANNWVVKLNGTDYVTFKGIKVVPTGGTYCSAIVLANGATHNHFTNNYLFASSTSTTIDKALFRIEDAASSYCEISNNRMTSGSAGIYLKGTSATSQLQGIEVKNNIIENFLWYGVRIEYANAPVVDYNIITSDVSGTGTKMGISLSYAYNALKVTNNKIVLSNSTNTNGIHGENLTSTSTATGLFANNFLSILNGTTYTYGFRFYPTPVYQNIYYNSLYIYGNSTTDTRGFNLVGGNNLRVMNNSIFCNRYPTLYEGSPSPIVVSDYNNMYSSSGIWASYSTSTVTYSTLAAYTAGTGFEAHSVAVDPIYLSTSNLHASAVDLNSAGSPVPEVTTDIDGQLRNALTPDLGADEFTPLAIDAGILAILAPVGQTIEGQTAVPVVILKNYGASDLTSCGIEYTIGGVLTGTYTWTGLITSAHTDTVTLPGFVMPSASQQFCAYTTLSGDSQPGNDSKCISLTPIVNVCNYAMYFDGNGDWVEVPANSTINSTDYTLEAWIKPEAFASLAGILSKYPVGTSGYVLRCSSTSPYNKINFNEADANFTLTANQWYHLAAVRANGTNTLYINGVPYAIAGSALSGNNNSILQIGTDYGNRWWKGLIDEVRIWGVGLTQAEIVAWANKHVDATHPEYSQLRAYYNFDQPGGYVPDLKNTNNGIIHNSIFTTSDAPFICADNDAWITSIYSPSGQAIENTLLTPKVIIKNMGVQDITTMNIYYAVNGGTPVSFAYNGFIASNSSDTVELAQFMPVTGISQICAWVDLANDANSTNDSICSNFETLPQVCNYSMNFTGNNHYMQAPSGNYFNGSFTFEFWAYNQQVVSSGRFIEFYNSVGNSKVQVLQNSSGIVQLSIYHTTTAQTVTATTALPLNTWTHVAVTSDGVLGKIYYNGVLQQSGSVWAPTAGTFDNCRFGTDYLGTNGSKCNLDEIRLWSVPLTESTIAAWKNIPVNNTHPNYSDLKLYYDFNQGIGTPVSDMSVNSLDAALYAGLYSINSAPVVCDPYDASITGIVNPTGIIVENLPVAPVVLLTNLGLQPLTNASIYYTFGVDTLLYNYTGNLLLGETDTINMPGLTVPPGSSASLCAWVVIPNDANAGNNMTCMSYTVMVNACNHALYFDGASDHVQIPNAPDLQALGSLYTLECWIKPSEFQWLDGIISKYPPGPAGFQLRMGQNSPYNRLNFDESDAGPVMVANQWYHIAAVNNNGIHKLYVNGVEYQTSASAVYNPSTSEISFGSDYGERWFKGLIDEVRIWNAALSQSDVTTWMNHPVTNAHPEYVNMLGYWKFDDMAPVATDSKNSHNGIIYGAVYVPSDAPFACGTNDVGITAITTPVSTYFSGNLNNIAVNVFNFGTDTIYSMNINYTINGGAPVVYNWTGTLLPVGTVSVSLPAFIGPAGTCTITANTDLAGDVITYNNSKTLTVTAISPYEIALSQMLAPTGGCGMTSAEPVIIKLHNNGDSIQSGLTLHYMINNDTLNAVSQAFSGLILPLSDYEFTFNVPANLFVGTSLDSTYQLNFWAELTGETNVSNNQLSISVESIHSAVPPIGYNDTTTYGNTATLTATSAYPVYWFNTQTGGTSLATGTSFVTPVLYDTTTYWVETSESVPFNTTVGNGTSSSYYAPFNGLWDYSWSSSIYTAAEIGAPMEITSIWYYVNNTPASYALNTQKIYMGHSASATFSNGNTPDVTSMQLVFSGNVLYNGSGWKEFVLSTPFIYNGTDNLEICSQNWDGSWVSGYPTFNYTSVTNSTKYAYSDGSFPGSGTLSYYKPNLKLVGSSVGCPSDRVPVTAVITNIPDYDIGITQIVTPQSGFLLNSNEQVTVVVQNYGGLPASNFNISLDLDNNYSVTEMFAGPLLSGQSATYTFTTTLDLSAFASYNLCVNVDMVNDYNSNNDSLCTTIVNQPLSYCTSSANYNSWIEIVLFGINGWENNSGPAYGAMYTDFTSLTPPEAIIGQTVTTKVKPQWYNYTYGGFSNYKIYIDYNQDGNFDPITEMAFGTNVWDQNLSYGSITIPPTAHPGTTGLRVVHVQTSDPNAVQPCGTYSYGETEDYLITLHSPIPHDAGITGIIEPSGYMIENSTEPVQVTLQNFGYQPITSVDIHYTINGSNPVTQTWTGNLAAYSNTVVNLANLTVPQLGFDLCAYTVLTGDTNTYNDELCVNLYGSPQHQVAIQSVGGVASGCNLGNTHVIINFTNLADTIHSGAMTLNYSVNGGQVVTETLNTDVLPAVSSSYTFITALDQTVTIDTQFDLVAWVSLTNDPFTNNDSLEVVYYSSVSPVDPMVADVTIFANEMASISANPSYSNLIYTWFNQYGSPLASGSVYTTPALTDTTLYMVQASNGAAYGGCLSNTVPFNVNVIYADYDGKITQIVAPTSGSFLTAAQPVTVTIYNNGLLPLSNFAVGFAVNGGTTTSETVTDTLQPGASMNYTFTGTANLFQNGYGPDQDGYGIYNVCAFTQVANDGFTGNDTLCTSVNNMNGDGLNCSTAFTYGEVNDPAIYSSTTAAYDAEWYLFTATTDYTNVTVSLCGSSYDSYVSVWDSCGATSYMAINDDYCGTQSQVSFSYLTAGTYYVKVYGYSSYYGNFTLNITGTQVAPFSLAFTTDAVDCNNTSTGSINMTVTNSWGTTPFTYHWSNNMTTEDISNLTAGVYTVTVSDASGNSVTGSATVTQPDAYTVTPAITNVATMGANTGAISLTVTGATAPYSFIWNNGATTQNLSSLYGGNYAVTITDALGCQHSASYDVTAPTPPGWTVTPTANKHLIYVAGVIPVTLDGTAVPYGSYVGLFYNQGTTPVCAGYFIWSGINTTLVAYGSTSGLDNGFNVGEAFAWKLYEPSQQDEFNTTVTYSASYPNQGTFVLNGFSGLTSINAVSIITQTIHLPEGWSMWSTYINPVNPNVAAVLADICQSGVAGIVTIVKNGAGNIYWPAFGINTIGNVQINQGYQIKIVTGTTTGTNFGVTGLQIIPETTPITIIQGWSIISYLRSVQGNIATIMAPVTGGNCIAIVKNGAGNIYWPQFNLNTIGNMKPGEGYQVKNTCTALSLTYPANNLSLKTAEVKPISSSHFSPVTPSGNNMTLGIPVSAWDVLPNLGDEFAVRNANMDICGTAVFEGDFVAVTVWGNELINPYEDKSTSFELAIEKFNNLTGLTEKLFVEEWSEGNGYFATDKIAIVSKIKTIQNSGDDDALGQNFPNPFTQTTFIPFYLSEDGAVVLKVFNQLGEVIDILVNDTRKAGSYTIELNRNLPAGNYYYQLTTRKVTATKSFSVN